MSSEGDRAITMGNAGSVGSRRSARPRTLLQVPEVCAWNDYVVLSEEHLSRLGYQVLHPGLCRDEPGFDFPASLRVPSPCPDVVHVHWPEKLGRGVGFSRAIGFLTNLVDAGARLVQTVHNLAPHEGSDADEVRAFLTAVDRLTIGVHFFSAEHEELARKERPQLPDLALHLAHPRYPGLDGSHASPRADGRSIGCFGRLRPYKRTDAFAEAFHHHAGPEQRLVVAGFPDEATIHRDLQLLARVDDRITYRPGFHTEDLLVSLMREVGWVALPYRRIWSSGILVLAVQLGRWVLSSRPVGMDAYGAASRSWLVTEPWDDATAIRFWRAMTGDRHPEATLLQCALPSWPRAAQRMTAFYEHVCLMPTATAT